MLELRPTCEHCNKKLSPDSTDAMICSYECTFCHDCVENFLNNVCPNCGGGFTPRPVRPAIAWKPRVSLSHQPASQTVVHSPVDLNHHRAWIKQISAIPPDKR